VNALVTGSAGGLGRVIVARLREEGYEVEELDLTTGFDVTDPAAWECVGPVDLAVLNAGVLTGENDVSALTPEQYRRAVAVNVDGVVLGVRRLATVMPEGSAIVATASLAGLVEIPDDPIYGLTKFAVVGFVRSAAPQLAARGIKLNALCPAWADTPLVPDDLRSRIEARGWRLLEPERVADGVLAAARSEGHGESWIVQVGREPLAFKYPGVPGPR
jgi:NAD(P)-dependent dehydrogenase (short-subunit alcohol dehydrogenase family)